MKNFWLLFKTTIDKLLSFTTNFTLNFSKKHIIFWLTLSLFFSTFYSYFALQEAFSGKYVIQDDARQHVFWMARFVDPELFPNDIIADYFQEAAPLGYTKLYQFFAFLGIHPLLLHKLLPISLGLIATIYIFLVTLEILPIPFSGFCAAIFLNQSLWTRDDLVSATPAAFAVPILCSFLYYYITENKLLTLLCMGLLGLFYPQCLLLASGLVALRIFRLRHQKIQLSSEFNDYIWLAVAGLVTLIVLLPYVIFNSPFGEIITKAEAKNMPVFQAEGWSAFFNPQPMQYWFCGKRSGFIPTDWCRLYRRGLEMLPPQVWLCLLLPPLYFFKKISLPLEYNQKKGLIIIQLAIISLAFFFLSHAVAFELHLPNRYTEHSLKIIFAVGGSIFLTIGLMAIIHKKQAYTKQLLRSIFLFFIIVYIPIGYPILLNNEGYSFPSTDYIEGQYPEIYDFLKKQPKDSLIASLVPEVNNLPSFAQHSILVGGSGYALPYHKEFFQEMEKRTIELIKAQYSSDFQQVSDFINQYGVDFWLLNKSAFAQSYIQQDEWLKAFAHYINPQKLLNKESPILKKYMNRCAVVQKAQLILINVNCLLKINHARSGRGQR